MENFIRKAKDYVWILGVLVSLVFGYFSIISRIDKTEEKVLKIEQKLDTTEQSLQTFYEFYRHNECSLLTVEKEKSEYAKLTFQQLCISDTYK